MKNILLLLLLNMSFLLVGAQEFDKQIATAKSAYEAGNFEESRFAVQNALREIDIHIGKEVLAVLPKKINELAANSANDQVTGSGSGYIGLFIERTWGNTSAENFHFSVISDSPLISTVNAFLALPMIMYSNDSNQKKIKVQGYKAMLERKVNEETGKVTGYSLMLTYSNALLQLEYFGEITEDDFMVMANQVPIPEITKIAR